MNLADVRSRCMADPALCAEYEWLGPDYALAAAIIRYLSNHNATCATLVKRARLSTRIVKRMRGAMGNPTLRQLKKMVRALDISMAEMLGEIR